MKPAPRRLLAVALIAWSAVTLTGCGGGSKDTPAKGADVELSTTPSAQVTGAPPSDAKTIVVTVGKDTVSPSGTQVQVKLNQPIVFQIDAVEAGELHVHSTPAKAIDYPAGKSQVQITIDKPGVVEAEIENLGKLVVQLEVR